MKKLAALLLMSAVIGSASLSYAQTGAEAAHKDESYTMEEMLRYAYEDEHKAKYEYEYLINEEGFERPFTNILKAEERHIAALDRLYELKGIEAPEIQKPERSDSNQTREEVFKAEAEAERLNIAMYEKFLKEDLDAETKAVFENLMKGSRSHLTAYERNLEGGQGTGRNSQKNQQTARQGQGRNNSQGNIQNRQNNTNKSGNQGKGNGGNQRNRMSQNCTLDAETGK